MIVAVKKNNNIVVGISTTDTYDGQTERDMLLQDNVPFWKVSGTDDCFVFADAPSYTTDVLRYNDDVFKGISDYNSLIMEVVPKMKELLAEKRCLTDKGLSDCTLIIVKGDKLFEITTKFLVKEEDEWTSSENKEAMAGAYEECKDLSAEETVLFAYRNILWHNSNPFPLILFDATTKKKKIVRR